MNSNGQPENTPARAAAKRYSRPSGPMAKLDFNLRIPVCLRMLIYRFQDGERDHRQSLVYLLIGLVLVSTAVAVLIHLPQAPYNVRELFGDNPLVLSLPLFALFLIWSASAPNLLARITIICPFLQVLQPLVLLIMALPAWLLLRFSVSTESLIDILGEHPGEWSMFVAFLGLMAPLLLSLFVWNLLFEGSAWLNRRFGLGHMLAALFIGLPILWVSIYIVTDQAATQRLIQLSAQGPFWLIGGSLAAAMSLLTLNGVLLAWVRIWGRLSRILTLLLTPVLLGLSWLLLNQGLKQESVGFLLGQTANAANPTLDLFFRWGLLYLGAVVLIALAHQIPFGLSASSDQQRHARPHAAGRKTDSGAESALNHNS